MTDQREQKINLDETTELGSEDTEETKPSTSRRKRWISAGVGLVVALVIAAVVMNGGAKDANGAEKEDAAEEETAVPVEVVEAVEGTVAAYISATANLVAENDVAVLSEVEGRVTSLLVDEGDRVARGQVLARLDPSDEEIAVKKAELRHANAKLAYDRGRDLAAKELISREEGDRLTVDFQIASQELAEAEWALAQTVIKAPFAGQVTVRQTQLGQHVRPGDTLFQITDFDPLIARIYLSESDIVGLQQGTEARIHLNADPGVTLRGRIRQISPVVDTATGTVKVTVEAISPPPQVRSGSFVSIHVVRETRDGALLVPREAVLRELQASHVFVNADGTAAKRVVEIGLEEAGRLEVLSGVEPGERVIVAGQGGLRDGTKVRVLGEEADPATEAADGDLSVEADAG